MTVVGRTVLVIAFSDLARDPRVDRQIRWLKDQNRVIAAGFAPPSVDGVGFVDINPPPNDSPTPIRLARTRLQRLLFTLSRVRNIPRRFRRNASAWVAMVRHLTRRPHQYEREYWSDERSTTALRVLGGLSADLVVANDLEAVPLALRLARGAPVLFDAHEYAPREYDHDRWFRIYHQPYRTYLCRTYVPRCAAVTTICDGIATEYERQTGSRPVIVTNAPDYESLTPRIVVAEPDRIRLVHHGIAAPVRKIELMIQMMPLLGERFELNLMFGRAEPSYLDYLRTLASGLLNVHFLPAVPMRELPRFTNQFDVGVILVEPINFNYLHGLGNKFFEYIQARLALAIGPLPEMARMVRRYDLGVVSRDFTPAALASELRRLDRAAIERYKRHAHECARELSSERNGEIVRSLVERLAPDAFLTPRRYIDSAAGTPAS